ncbi:hypothetical protein BJV82DRAFT_608195 [Fennellomyces sp. T-0311]|nr:hypothetical protein BJV82DRAFT_608195 [Fennellomyces sp. T-0311]
MWGILVEASPLPNMECQTPACHAAAKKIMEFVDLNADPCTDFYQYSCGSWMKSHMDIPSDSKTGALGTLLAVEDETTTVLREILEGNYEDLFRDGWEEYKEFHMDDQMDIDKENFKTLQDYYGSCMDVDALNTAGPTPIYPLLSKMLSHFPNDSEHKFGTEHVDSFTKTMIELDHQGVGPFFSTIIDADDKQSDTIAIKLQQPILGLHKEAYEEPEELKSYRGKLINAIYEIIGIGKEENSAFRFQKAQEANIQLLSKHEIATMVDHIIWFEKTLASISMKGEDLQDPVKKYNPMTIKELQAKYPIIDWTQFFTSFAPPGTPVPNSVIVESPSYFASLTALLLPTTSSSNSPNQNAKGVSGVDLHTMREYLTVAAMANWAYALGPVKSSGAAKFFSNRIMQEDDSAKSLMGTTKQYTWCIDRINLNLGNMMGRYFVMRTSRGESERSQIENYIKSIHEAWKDRLSQTTWLDDATRKAALQKLEKIRHKIGYSTVSPDIRSPASLKKHYSPLTIDRNSFFTNEVALRELVLNRFRSKYGKPVDKNEMGAVPQTVNAYYNDHFNEIIVPAGIAQSPVYTDGAPSYLNYGGLGFIVGHEFSHAFDNRGRMYDGDGKLDSWWSPQAAKEYEERSQCFVEQYNGFTVEGRNNKSIHVNGKYTLDENLADSGGLPVALHAYKNSRNNLHGVSHDRLPGIDLTPEELFFVNVGISWCWNARTDVTTEKIYVDSHAPSKYRINGVCQNSNDFAQAFKCAPGTPMNPVKKCTVW